MSSIKIKITLFKPKGTVDGVFIEQFFDLIIVSRFLLVCFVINKNTIFNKIVFVVIIIIKQFVCSEVKSFQVGLFNLIVRSFHSFSSKLNVKNALLP